MNIEKQIEYWINSAESDLETARILIENNKPLEGLFFCHLVIEKTIKSHIVKLNKTIPPKSHNLIYLSDLISIEISNHISNFFGILMKYQLSGRYPDYNPYVPEKSKVLEYFETTKEVLEWLKNQL